MSNNQPQVVDLIKNLSVLEYKPGDIIIVQVSMPLSDEARQRLENTVHGILSETGISDAKVIVIDEGAELGVLRRVG